MARLRVQRRQYRLLLEERARIARDLHDNLAQTMTAIGLELDVIERTGQAAPEVTEETRWFALFGLAPLSDLDSQTLAGSARDYVVTTKFTVMDVVISAFTSFATFYRQTVIIEK